MTNDEKLNKVVRDFSLLPDEKQNYVLGILQSLVFACYGQENPSCDEICHDKPDEMIPLYKNTPLCEGIK